VSSSNQNPVIKAALSSSDSTMNISATLNKHEMKIKELENQTELLKSQMATLQNLVSVVWQCYVNFEMNELVCEVLVNNRLLNNVMSNACMYIDCYSTSFNYSTLA